MMPIDVPTLGNLLIGAILLASAWTFSLAVRAARGRPHLLPAVRGGMYLTIATIVSAVFLLAYAFQSHDFRIRYVEHYSDRTMSPLYLWTALWGGQDGSLLWWSFLLSMYTLGFTLWIRKRYIALQAVTFASLASVFAFFAVLMMFAANPFATSHSVTAVVDGQGLNPLLQNYWMAIHPPALYMGLTGWAIPASIAVAALVTGRLGEEWIVAARRWVLLAWGFLTLGNMLGMFWSYEELGWGGYWAWDPVENASFMPWLLASAYLHSVMIQERRGMLKVWNVSLILGAFFLTIFGTFLTRSGLIASVHSFARSDIGIWFAWYMVLLAIVLITLVAWRLPELRGKLIDGSDVFLGLCAFLVPGVIVIYAKGVEIVRRRIEGERMLVGRPAGSIESMLSREFTFLLNNWILLGMLVFVMVSTTFPLLSEAVRGETVTVGPAVYNQWMVPFGLCLLFLMGVGPVVSWRKATGKNLLEAFRVPVICGVIALIAHAALGGALGYPAFYESEPIYDTVTGDVLAWIKGWSPLACTTISGFVTGTLVQEFWRATAARRRATDEGVFTALLEVIGRARRRFGGYIVHFGVVLSYLGFMGAAYDVEREDSLAPGEVLEVAGFTFEFEESRDEIDVGREMLFADLTVHEGSTDLGTMSPAKFLYRTHPDMPTTEVAIRSTPGQDLYTILSSIDATGNATVRVIVRPFVWWIWVGGLVALLGVFVAAFPSLKEVLGEETETKPAGGGLRPALIATLVLLAIGTALVLAGTAHAQEEGSTLHAGNITIDDPTERQLFERLLCRCGDCPRLPLSTCSCSVAENARTEIRARLAAGASLAQITDEYRERFGTEAIAVPADAGMDRLMWAVPVVGLFMALVGLYTVGRRWRAEGASVAAAGPGPEGKRTGYDDKLDDELRRFDE